MTNHQKRLPIATCIRCEHKIYAEEDNHESRSFVNSSGNNAREYFHIKCPRHKMEDIRITTTYKCLDCGVLIDEVDNP